MFKNVIIVALARATGLNVEEIHLETPEREEHGDYSSNVAMQLFSRNKEQSKKDKDSKSPHGLAERIVEDLLKDKELQEIAEKIEVAGTGFINFWLKKGVLLKNLIKVVEEGENFGESGTLKGKKYLLEHTSPNTIKTLHVGHVRNNVLGMAVHNILEFAGAEVTLDAINNDRGIHVMKAVWAYMKYGEGKTPEGENVKPDHFVDRFYVMGVKEAENPQVKEEMQTLLKKWEDGDGEVRNLWSKLRSWTLEGFRKTYERLGSSHDYQWFESDFYMHGKEMVEEGLEKGIFKRLEDGAVLSDLGKYGLSDTIVLRADGTSMYHTQDLYLTKLKREKFPSDLYIWDIGPEQELYLKQLITMCEQLEIGSREDYYHMPYGFVYLKGMGKMSSRAGNVISADKLIDEAVAKTIDIINSSETGRDLSDSEKEEISEFVGLGAIKYGFLKLGRTTDLQFDLKESLSLEGDSGPYIQYTYARTQSVMRKALGTSELGNSVNIKPIPSTYSLMPEEYSLLRSFIQFSDVIAMSAKNYSPNILCNYLYVLASKFNLFYQKCDILEQRTKDKGQSEFRLLLTSATGQILKNGLNLLGIQTPERM